MATVDVSAEDDAWIHAAHDRAQEHDAYWATRGAELAEEHAGEWVAFRGREILAHSRDPDELERQLEQLDVDRSSLLIRFIPPPDRDFAF